MKPPLILRMLFLLAITVSGVDAQTATLFTVEQNGSRAKRINIVFLSEGYTTADMPNFAAHVNAAVNFLFSKEPWQQYRSYCNVYRIEIASNQSGCDNGNTSGPGGVRDTYFNTGFTTPGIPQLLTFAAAGASRAYSLLNSLVPEYDVPVVLVNDSKYGGSGGGISLASADSQSSAIIEHEIGHSFAMLADEYDVDYPNYTPEEKPNNTAQTARDLIRWNHWIDASIPVPTPETAAYDGSVGLFEGSMYRTTDWYRPHNNSLMKNLNRPCGAVNREQFVLSYYTRVSPVDNFSPGATSRSITTYESLNFTVTPKVPSSGFALVKTWKIDNVSQPGATGNTFSTTSENLGNGIHKISVVVRDPTAFVRYDPGALVEDTVTWTLTLSNQLPPNLTAWRATYGSDTDNPANDGLNNLAKYALGLDPAKPATVNQFPTGALTTSGPSTFLTLTIPRRNKRTEVEYVAEVSSDLKIWNSGPGHTVTLQDSDSMLIVRDTVPLSSTPGRFMRLRVREI